MKVWKKSMLVLTSVILSVSLAACSSGTKSASSAAPAVTTDASATAVPTASNEQVNLTFWNINGPGLDDVIKQYQADHPNIKVKVEILGDKYRETLNAALSAGSGAPDVVIETLDDIVQFKKPDFFYNLNDYGAAEIKNDYLESRWMQGASADGKIVYGIPTDSGPMAMAYRTDIFKAAGLPTDSASVSKLVATWDDYFKTGQIIKEKTGKAIATDAYFGAFLPLLQQAGQYTIFDKDGKLGLETNPGVKNAWDFAAKLSKAGLTAKAPDFSNDWSAGLKNGDFATLFSPPWMLGVIKQNAPDAAGKWDVALMPGGSASWGGSFLLLPKQGKHPKEAYEFIKWILAPAQQLAVNKTNGNFPTTPSVYTDDEFKNKKDEFFSNALTNQIYTQAAEKLTMMDTDHDWAPITNIVGQVLANVEKGSDPVKGWADVISQSKALLER